MSSQCEQFLQNEFATLSILGALGRSNTYVKKANETRKSELRIALRLELHRIGDKAKEGLSEDEHMKLIVVLADKLSAAFSDVLDGKRFRIGIAQKAINLYLKYLWCAGKIARPPHCPFDSIIIKKLPGYSGPSWTKIDDIEHYIQLVRLAKNVAKDKSLPEWEMFLWNQTTRQSLGSDLFR